MDTPPMNTPPADASPRERGTLRVYLGAAPGVGKTFAMLAEGRRRRERGTDVVIGFVETHARAGTVAAIGDLEIVPPLPITLAGAGSATQSEMDLDTILARRPHVVLVDELAHTNLPTPPRGSAGNGASNRPRSHKRWQDVQELLAAGIHVITTVNIQHLESLNDVTAQITGVRQRETVPDAVVRAADQIELVDMSPQALRRRMAHGNVYGPLKVDAALSNYFREGNLTALRELALLWVADRVEENLERYRHDHRIQDTWATRARIVVPVSGGEESEALMRRAAQVAARRSGGEWLALYVTRHDGLSGVSPDRLTSLRETAEALGGTFHAVVGDDVADAVLDFTRAENANQVVIGVSRRSRVSTLLRPGVGERVVAGAGDVDVLLVSHDQARSNSAIDRAPALSRARRRWGYGFAIVAPWAATALMLATPSLHGLPTEAMALMSVVVGTALIGGLLPAVLAALLSGMLLNWFFTPPVRALTIAEPGNIVALILFIVVGIAVATVVDHSARRSAQARRARAQADALTVLSHSLLTSSDDLVGLLTSATGLFGATSAAVLRTRNGVTEVLAQVGEISPHATPDVRAAIDAENALVLYGGNHTSSERGLLQAYAAYAQVMAERQEARAAEVERGRLLAADRTRTALLRAVSHDLRSPLAAVQASVQTLRDPALVLDSEDRAALLENIDVSAGKLAGLVTNLLDMSRIHAGAVTPLMEQVDLGAVVATVVLGLEAPAHVDVSISPGTVALADAGLLDRVLANVLENAVKYSPEGSAVRIDASTTPSEGAGAGAGRTIIRIADAGPGVAEPEQERMFAPFQRLDDVPTRRGVVEGVGLGLAVARGLIEAQGGTISSEETPGGGLTFVIDLAAAPSLTPSGPTHSEEPA